VTLTAKRPDRAPLHHVTVTDSRTGTISCPKGTLAPGAEMTCTVTATTTAADLATGNIPDSAVARGRTPAGAGVFSDPAEALGLSLLPEVPVTG